MRFANVFAGSLSGWERWTSVSMPEGGEYVAPGALNPVQIDVAIDVCILTEPNVWMIHDVTPSSAGNRGA